MTTTKFAMVGLAYVLSQGMLAVGADGEANHAFANAPAFRDQIHVAVNGNLATNCIGGFAAAPHTFPGIKLATNCLACSVALIPKLEVKA
jgi:hypothetical protein